MRVSRGQDGQPESQNTAEQWPPEATFEPENIEAIARSSCLTDVREAYGAFDANLEDDASIDDDEVDADEEVAPDAPSDDHEEIEETSRNHQIAISDKFQRSQGVRDAERNSEEKDEIESIG